ncbi:MAG: hypothetical protein WC959_00195 [Kiritimatiellales bacterium]
MKKIGLGIIILYSAAIALADVVIVPFEADFTKMDPQTNAAVFTVLPHADITLTSTSTGLTATTTSKQSFAIAVDTSGASLDAKGFTIEATFFGNQASQHQMRLFALGDNLTVNGGSVGYQARLTKDILYILNGATEVAQFTWDGGAAIRKTTQFDLSLTGTYDASGSLTLSFTAKCGELSETLVWTDTNPATPTGDYFGVSGRFFNTDEDLTISGFSVVPEPSSVTLLLFSSTASLFIRRAMR